MSDNAAKNELIDNVEPPEVKLSAPVLSQTIGTWLVVAKNRRVNRDWEALMQRYPENCCRCYQDLCNAPTTREPKRVFPLKGKVYQGAWGMKLQAVIGYFMFQMRAIKGCCLLCGETS